MTTTGVLERVLARELERALELVATRWYHTHDSRRSVEGFPDYVILAKDGSLLFAELKRMGGSPTPAQADWLRELAAAGHPSFLVGGAAGVSDLVAVLTGISKGRRLLPAAYGSVVVLGAISPAGLRAVALVDGPEADGAPAAGDSRPPARPTRGIRRPRRGW